MDQLLQILGGLFGWVGRASIHSCAIVVIVALAQWLLGKRLRPSWRYAMWALVLVRLAMPAVPSSPTSWLNLLPTWGGEQASIEHQAQQDVSDAMTAIAVPVRAPANHSDAPTRMAAREGTAPHNELASARPAPVAHDTHRHPTLAPRPSASSEDRSPAKQAPVSRKMRTAEPTAVGSGTSNSETPKKMEATPAGTAQAKSTTAGPTESVSQRTAAPLTETQEVIARSDSPAPSAAGAIAVGDASPPSPANDQRPAQRDGSNWIWLSLTLIWLAGVAAMLARFVAANVILAVRLGKARRHGEDDPLSRLLERCRLQMGIRSRVVVLTTSAVDGPALAGVFRPRVLLPDGLARTMTDAELRFIFLHELAHVKRHDVAVGGLCSVLAALHWFNPLVHWAFGRMRAERELACDAMVLSRTPAAQGPDYGMTIVKLLERFSGSGALGGAVGVLEDKRQMRRRMTMIASYKPAARRWAVLALAITVVLGAVLLTDAQSQTPPPDAKGAIEPGPVSKGAASADQIRKLEAHCEELRAELAQLHRRFGPKSREVTDAETRVKALDQQIGELRGEIPFHEIVGGADAWDVPPAADNAAITKALKTKLAKVGPFDNLEFDKVITFLRDVSGLNIEVKWAILSQAGIAPSTKITVKLNDVTLETALKVILDQAGGTTPLGYVIEDNVLTISTREDLSRRTSTRVFDIRDLLIGACFNDGQVEPAAMEELTDTIRQNVDPESWRPEGTVGTINVNGPVLVITQAGQNMAEVEALLGRIREARIPAWQREIAQKLRKPMKKIDMKDIDYHSALVFVREATGVSVVLDPKFEKGALPQVTISAQDLTGEQVLGLIARMADLECTLTDGVVYIGQAKPAAGGVAAPAVYGSEGGVGVGATRTRNVTPVTEPVD